MTAPSARHNPGYRLQQTRTCGVANERSAHGCTSEAPSGHLSDSPRSLEVPRLSVEQRLEILGVTYTPRFVSMVLNRCFKKRYLGFRFFDWVMRVPGFQPTTETYNTMLYIAGKKRSFGAIEELLDVTLV
ncbi:hypothetical protein ABZP36_010339 [Zizania latifolia]